MQPDWPTRAVRRRRFFLRSCPGPTPHQRPVFSVESALTDWLFPRNVAGRVRGTNIWWDPVCTVAVVLMSYYFNGPDMYMTYILFVLFFYLTLEYNILLFTI
jgi:hypothetical protein